MFIRQMAQYPLDPDHIVTLRLRCELLKPLVYVAADSVAREPDELFGLVVHSGSLKGGHYVAYVRVAALSGETGEEEWQYASDSTVSRSSEAQALGQQPFLLFYRRRDGR